MMTPAEEGAYIRLICYAWAEDDCGLPDDDETLARLSRLGEGWLKGGSRVVRQCFKKKGNRLIHPRLQIERKKQRKWREKSREGGIESGKARRSKGYPLKGGSQMVQPNSNQTATLQSSTSVESLSSENKNTPLPPKGGKRGSVNVPYSEIVDLYHKLCPTLPKLRSITDGRKKAIRSRWIEYGQIEEFRSVFEAAGSSDFLNGQEGEWFGADFDWLIRPSNFIKVLEGNYNREKATPKPVNRLKDPNRRKGELFHNLSAEEMNPEGKTRGGSFTTL